MSGGGGGGGDTWRPDPKPVVKSPGIGSGGKAPGGGSGGDGQPDPCAISEITSLNSVDRVVLATVQPGDVLDVVYASGPPRRLIVKTAKGSIVGSITSPSMPQLIQCITQADREYKADVLSIRGAVCQTRVRPA